MFFFFAAPWTVAHQASLSLTIPQSLLKLMFTELVNAIQSSYPLSPPSPSALNLSQQQGFASVSSLHQVAKYWSFNFSNSLSNEYSRLIFFRIDWFYLLAVHGTPRVLQFKSINFSALSLLYCPFLTYVRDYWKNHSFDYTDLCQQSEVSAF